MFQAIWALGSLDVARILSLGLLAPDGGISGAGLGLRPSNPLYSPVREKDLGGNWPYDRDGFDQSGVDSGASGWPAYA